MSEELYMYKRVAQRAMERAMLGITLREKEKIDLD